MALALYLLKAATTQLENSLGWFLLTSLRSAFCALVEAVEAVVEMLTRFTGTAAVAVAVALLSMELLMSLREKR